MHYNWNWGVFWQTAPDGGSTYIDLLLSGLTWTLLTAAGVWTVAMLLGSVVGVARTVKSKWAVVPATGYVELFRNIPLLVQLFLWYFVFPELLPTSAGIWLKQMPNAAFWTAVVGIGLYTSARVAEQVRAGIQALPRGQGMAARATGLTELQTYRYVLLPMAFRIIIPPLTSELLSAIKNTSVALPIGLLELTNRAQSMSEFTYQTFEAFTAVTVVYLAINSLAVIVMGRIERRCAVPGYVAEK